jgi:HEAT repeat protein
MGAWGTGYFENDGALDALAELSDDPSVAKLLEIFDGDKEDYIETDFAESIIAAAAVLTVADGVGVPVSDNRIDPIISALGKPSKEIRKRAAAALKRVMKRSETAELWADADPADNKVWREGIETMIAKLRA